jgi:Putative peptidoglycan binding domain/Protein of unknown function (DUF1236)
VFASNNVPRVDNVNFAVRVGTTVPSSVHLVVVPETLVEIYPQWRDDEYFVVRDEVVIVDHSHRIVAVVPTGSSSASSSSSESAYASSRSGTAQSINLSQDEVRQLQITLNQRGFNVGEPDGNFGPRTRAALMQFQQREGLQRTGQIDQQTMSALGINAGGHHAGLHRIGEHVITDVLRFVPDLAFKLHGCSFHAKRTTAILRGPSRLRS